MRKLIAIWWIEGNEVSGSYKLQLNWTATMWKLLIVKVMKLFCGVYLQTFCWNHVYVGVASIFKCIDLDVSDMRNWSLKKFYNKHIRVVYKLMKMSDD